MKTTALLMISAILLLSTSCARRCCYKRVYWGMTEQSHTLIDNDLITVLEYKEFIYHQPDSLKALLIPQEELALTHYDIVGNLNEPVYGISSAQATAYCQWRTKIWNEKNDGKKYSFRLPELSEVERAAKEPLTDIKWREALADAQPYLEMDIAEGELSTLEGQDAYFFYDEETAQAFEPLPTNIGFRCVAQISI